MTKALNQKNSPATKKNRSKLPNWDLSDLYTSVNDPKREQDKKSILNSVKKFNKTYKGKIKKATPSLLLKALKDYEHFDETLSHYFAYIGLLHSTHMDSLEIGKEYQEARELGSIIATQLNWFDIELKDIPDKSYEKLIKSPILKSYRHYLTHTRVFKPFILTEKEENILSLKAQTSRGAFVRFYDEFSSNQVYKYKDKKGKVKSLPFSEVTSILMHNPNRSRRIAAANALTQKNKADINFYTYVLNTLLLDKKVADQIRGYTYPQQATFLGYEVDPKMVQTMSEAITTSSTICQDFYKAKQKFFGHKLNEVDRYSSIYPNVNKKNSWDETKTLVLDAFNQFSPRFASLAQEFFDNNWIDVPPRKGKQSGAFCSYITPSKHPFILLNFTGEIKDVFTLAHELGHGIHSMLSRRQPLFEFHPSTATAEIASVFAEMLVFDYLMERITDKKLKINLLANRLQSVFATIFRQNAFYLYETDIHTHRREKGELSSKDFGDYYQKRLQPMFGTGLKLSNDHSYWWPIISHFYHYNFYVFTYSFGETLTHVLYEHYRLNGKTFIDKYIKALEAGGSKTPIEITQLMGLDITQKNFWQDGISSMNRYVEEFKELLKEE